MRHYDENELLLYHYGEGRRRDRIDEHLTVCDRCAALYREIASTLALADAIAVPERDDRYGLEVWQRIRHQLPERQAPWWPGWPRPALAGVVAVLVLAAFVAGRQWPAPAPPTIAVAPAAGLAADASERVRLAAVGDHLERSERVLLDLVNADWADWANRPDGPDGRDGIDGKAADVSALQAGAAELIEANRLYRDASVHAGDDAVAGVLDDLERNLLEVVNGPSSLTAAQLDALRVRVEAAALLFKLRVLSTELRERELASAADGKTT
jgi:hypothetical protein